MSSGRALRTEDTFSRTSEALTWGSTPSSNSNTVSEFLAGASGPLLVLFGPEGLAAAIVATMVTHTFLDAVPSTFLGVPDPDTVLSVLPAHRLCLAGHGEEAVRVSALGSVAGFVLCLPLFVVFMLVLPPMQGYIDWGIGLVILVAAGLLVVFSRSPGWARLRYLGCRVFWVCFRWGMRIFRLRWSGPGR